MQEANGTAEQLPFGDDWLDTGDMGDCVSIVVLWDWDDEAQLYEEVWGYHGYGGFDAVNLDSLLDGVPNDENTLVVALLGTLASESAGSNDRERVEEAIGERLGNARLDLHQGSRTYLVHRNGAVPS
jgi:hypothetical protein